MATIKDVAKQANVSIATVSRVVNNGPKVGKETRERVLNVMREIGYVPDANARALVKQKSDTIGVVVPDISDPFFAALASGIDKVARKNNVQMLLSTTAVDAEAEQKAIEMLIERRCESLVVHSKKLSDEALLTLAKRVPGMVIIDRYIEEIAERCIWLDNYQGGRIAARYLHTLGHKHVACITSSYQIEDPKLRLQGFTEGLSDVNVSVRCVEQGEPNQQGGEKAAQAIISQHPEVTAVFAYNDAMAIGAISTLEDNGYKVGQDISVIGFDDVLIARYSRPKLTTLKYPIELMAQQAAELALNINKASDNSPNISLYKHLPQLVKRESTHLLG
ncbi:LacI family DNA-binding transcriptional regulator [Thalassotalea agarivorans]|nr:LacI family DNA-binding transcriptional regulator [Thalassotalea agarivorans]